MATVAEVIRSGLRLINVPGRAAALSAEDTADALVRLQRIIDSAAVSKFFIPGVRRHFFNLNPNQDIYSYGPGGQLDTTIFGDPVPVAIEEAYIREGATITGGTSLSRGSDYKLFLIDQTSYNRRFTKGTGGRPYQLYWLRDFPLSEIRFDNAAIAGDILVMDVLNNPFENLALSTSLALWPQAIKWLEYRLAYEIAPQYGKAASQQHVAIMREAYNEMAAGNQRINNLRVDRALRKRPVFDINRGDP